MKRIWNIKKKSGVSPVIATILMVAITVVLAAVLYVMVMNMSGTPGNQTPQGSLTLAQKTTNGTCENVFTGQMSKPTRMTDCKVVIENLTSGQAILTTGSYTFAASTTGTVGVVTYTPSGQTALALGVKQVTYYDIANNNEINQGDYFQVYSCNPTTPGQLQFKISLVFAPTGDVISYLTYTF